ncbi:UDP-4-amino-4,6-dideoxy-N-acetyl-beta-L-altrosamine transaminase [Campylobacter sp. MIT 21-1685]|uniref:UDP-4-amino-4, 6-dideoxy-N-acetyl-beta-L-altrosamine transaminase n=1 Tax=unclassified Campylobacter TaxID=2593542 RepID=UPI00224AE98A|nr:MULTISPECIES: UDP-4-amino-4,6-dideoxy-N-acetyl-beta-L-altrosamine transaminase [unclassified Campylobacter]MCX2683192.1 UDP-4-amino-4,6-dideoxy-N-acetyl-beta-L-altrosamine transaminase [Campylobacter sp. MIT 21-1684]MCX2751488.1 UDP-4-amino-4,6-dideoxy-N-acetyl-beta-L-altrosamine transaminase [Campylobacter sp. MIT 21-1682]MCX2807673.1 UDP-4-amino-4,6-dideoxy-N-acetyl-beta-L-altrosamine transaminase [Campylobacter sp. MIT 21-1685]
MLSYSHQNIDSSDIEAVINALKSEFLTGGKKTEEFESALCEYLGVKYACVVNSATSALHLAYKALKVEGKIVLCTALSFVATSNAALMAGAKVEFIDIKNDGNIDEKKLQARLEKESINIAAVCVVDFAGNSVEIDTIAALCKTYHIPLIDDASHALGAEFKGQKVGSKADLSVFSFHPVKPITTFEGGVVVGNNEELLARIKLLRSHGIVKKRLWNSDCIELGYNYRLSDVACALGINQLQKLQGNLQKREEIANFYDKEFDKNPYFSIIKIQEYKKSSRHLYPILLFEDLFCNKEEIFSALIQAGVGVQVHYKPSYQFSLYKKLFGTMQYNNADNFYKAEISIPCHQEMNLKQAKFVVDTLFSILEKTKKGCCRDSSILYNFTK